MSTGVNYFMPGAPEPTDPAARAAHTMRTRRIERDEAAVGLFAKLIRGGDTTTGARVKMGIGAVRAKRLRAIAVGLRLIRRRQRKASNA